MGKTPKAVQNDLVKKVVQYLVDVAGDPQARTIYLEGLVPFSGEGNPYLGHRDDLTLRQVLQVIKRLGGGK